METAGPVGITGLLNGEWDIAEFRTVPVVQRALDGQEPMILLAAEHLAALYMIGGRGVRSPEDLRGLEIGVILEIAQTVLPIALRLVPQHERLLPPFTPGAHINVHIAPGLMRQYSLCGDPANTESYRPGIKLKPVARRLGSHPSFVRGRDQAAHQQAAQSVSACR